MDKFTIPKADHKNSSKLIKLPSENASRHCVSSHGCKQVKVWGDCMRSHLRVTNDHVWTSGLRVASGYWRRNVSEN